MGGDEYDLQRFKCLIRRKPCTVHIKRGKANK